MDMKCLAKYLIKSSSWEASTTSNHNLPFCPVPRAVLQNQTISELLAGLLNIYIDKSITTT